MPTTRSGIVPRHILLVLLLIVAPVNACTAQTSQGIEGVISHEVGHVLFSCGMAFLLWKIRREARTGAGWRSFSWFLSLILLWNIVTFVNHWLGLTVSAESYVLSENRIVGFRVTSFAGLLFYLTGFDHVVFVPAFAFLVAALRGWSRQT